MTAGLTKRQARMLGQATATAATLPELPLELDIDEWRWKSLDRQPAEYLLIGPDGWSTKSYQHAEKAIAEALRRVRSQPQTAAPPEQSGLSVDAERTVALASEQLAANRDNPAWKAGGLDEDEAGAPLPTPTPADALPLGELVAALDAHAKGLPRPLPLDVAIPLPAGLPERFPAPVGMVKPGRWQPRTVFDEAELQDLANSIAEHGVLNPLIVFAGEHGFLELIAGERRWRASQLAGLAFVPVEVRSYTMRQVAEIAAIDNLQRADLTAVEEGAIYNRLIAELGISEVALAKRIGRSRGNIQQKRAIASADPTIHQAVQNGAITFTIARTIIGAAPGDPKLQVKALKEVQAQLGKGKRLGEADVKQLADDLVLKSGLKLLSGLGWQHKEFYGLGTVLYAPGERPRVWSGAEVLEAVRAQRRPSLEEQPAAELAKDAAAALKAAGWTWEGLGTGHPWWYAIRRNYGLQQFVSPAELAQRGTDTQAELAALKDRLQAHGWTLKLSSTSATVKHKQGAEESFYRWDDLVAFVAKAEAGKVSTKKVKSSRYVPPQITCPRCKKPTHDYTWAGGTQFCTDCAPLVTAEREAAAAAFKRRITATVAAMEPSPAFEALAVAARWFTGRKDEGSDQEAVVRYLTHALGSEHSSHRVDRARLEALLGPDPGAPPAEASAIATDSPAFRIHHQLLGYEAGVSEDAEGLHALAAELEDLADVLDDAAYEALATRISKALHALDELAEAA